MLTYASVIRLFENFDDSFTIFWLSRTDRFRVPQMWGQFQICLDKYSPLLGSVQLGIGSSNIDFITHLQYDMLWGLPRRVFTLFQIKVKKVARWVPA